MIIYKHIVFLNTVVLPDIHDNYNKLSDTNSVAPRKMIYFAFCPFSRE